MEELGQLGRYQLLERLGVGTMGSVYRARDEALGREVAVKTIHTLGRSPLQLEVFSRRFEHEARALATLSHPNVVNVFDVGVEDGTPYLVMELVDGRSLGDHLGDQGRLPPAEVRALGSQLATALDAAHAKSIVHRDVKPANVLEHEGVWKLADFGVAHVPDSSLTLTGQFVGSPAYAAPEALEDGDFGPPSDVYGLGVTLYQALSGSLPFGDRGLGQLADGAVAPPIPGAPADLDAAIRRALERDPARRISAADLTRALAAGPPKAGSSVWRNAAIAAAVAMLIFGIALGAELGGSGGDSKPGAAPGLHPSTGEPRRDRDDVDPRAAERNEREWQKVERELEKGKPEKAVKHLGKILERDPGDRDARALFQRITGSDWDDWRDRPSDPDYD